MKTTGRYFKSLREFENATSRSRAALGPSIHRSGSVRGMRKQFWGYTVDVVRIGNWIYAATDMRF